MTSLGINNNGELVFPYGKEDTDFNIDGVPSSGYVFNGATSAFWCRLRDLLAGEITNTFNTVRAECFNATNLINQFDNFQACYPEEIWRLDVERKYIRTFTGQSMDNSKPKQDSQYLRDMMQGRKKYQRRQWVRDQEIYFGTKYLMNAVVGDHNRITFRCYDPGTDVVVPADYSLSITPFQDMYVSAMFGNGDQRQVRAKANETVVLNFSISTTTDTQVTIYGANRISALNDLSACYIAANNFSMATKLRRLVLGNTTPGYSNPRLVSLTLGENKLLEELDLRNCSNLTGALNLAQCSNLLRLYAEGTRITGATFATNGKVQIIHLPNTINALEMRNLNNLSDFQCGLDYLEQLTLQGGTLDNYALVSDTIDTLQVVYLYDVNWSVPNTNVLNALINAYYSQLTGSVYISGTTRLNEIATYQQAWPDLVVTYDPENLRQQFLATYVNTDGTILYQVYVDEGDFAPDPVATGAITTPTKPSDQQYTYTYSGWNTLEDRMYADREIVATYSLETRTYSVKWYGKHHNLLASREVPYGSEVNYGDILPVYTDDEVYSIYNLFAGWDKSTGYIREDTEVNAIWETKRPPANTTSLNDMSAAEIYAISQEASRIVGPTPISSYTNITEGSYIDINMGNDFNFTNVESEVLCENQFFDGTNYLDTGIKLFDVNSPSFTLAIDYEFYDVNNTESVLVSCVNGMQDQMNNGGFRIFYSGSPYISFQGSDQRCGCSYYRNMLVIRHQKGSGVLYAYASNASSENNPVYSDNIMSMTFGNVSSTLLNNDYTLVLGANKVVNNYGNATYINRGSGWINWCKIWYDDLGENNARELAQWPHETWRAQFSGSERYQMMDGRYAQLTFILNHTLSLPHVLNSSSSSQGGWQNMSIRSFLNDRMYKAFPIEWRSMLKRVSVRSNTGYGSTTVEASYDYIFLPAIVEINGTTVEPYRREGSLIPFFSDEFYRYRFSDLYRLNNSRMDNNGSLIQPPTYSGTTEPTTSVSNHVQKGDIWIRYMNANNHAFYYIPPDDDDIKHYRYISDSENVSASDGGIWVRAKIYWTRTPYTSYTYTNYAVNTRGNTLNAGVNTNYYLVPCFAV